MSKHFEHTSSFVNLTPEIGFFVDSVSSALSDNTVGQVLCGFAFDAGQQLSTSYWKGANEAIWVLTHESGDSLERELSSYPEGADVGRPLGRIE